MIPTKKIKEKITSTIHKLKLFAAWCLSFLYWDKNVWLVSEKTNEARDNGYWFYRFLREKHPEIKAKYVISKSAPDFATLDNINADIVAPNSLYHCILFWAAKYNVSSQPFGAHPYDYFKNIRNLLFLKRKSQTVVFLQHGIIKDRLSDSLNKANCNIDLFVASARLEQQSIMDVHGYNEDQCILTGLCRYDNLPNEKVKCNKQILVMPTFRHWIMSANPEKATDEEKKRFMEDEFFKTYNSFLNSAKLLEILDRYDYKVVFYPHYCAQPFLKCFTASHDRVILADKKAYDVQDLLINSDVLITDFSSVFFDFAYMKKPEVFYQFDTERYRKGHYKEGYFSYENNAFGPVFKTEEQVVGYLENLLRNECKTEDRFIERINTFFAYTDKKNCERTYNSIISYHAK